MIVAFCGHREVQEPENVRKWLVKIVEDLVFEGADCFFIGGYGQFDAMAAGVVLNLKQNRIYVPYLCCHTWIENMMQPCMMKQSFLHLKMCQGSMPFQDVMNTW